MTDRPTCVLEVCHGSCGGGGKGADAPSALIKENLAKYRAEVVPLLIMQNGQLSGAPALNKILAGAQTATLEAKNRRNAQSIISIFNAARAAGCRELDGVKSAAQAAALIRTGVSGAGQFSATRFQVTLDDPSLKAAIAFITYDPQKGLSYNENVELVSDQASAPASLHKIARNGGQFVLASHSAVGATKAPAE